MLGVELHIFEKSSVEKKSLFCQYLLSTAYKSQKQYIFFMTDIID